jgi:hypothetical protein
MRRSMVALLAAAMPLLAGQIHGHLLWMASLVIAACAGLAASFALPTIKDL